MFRKLWDYLNQVDYDTRQQMYGVRLLILIAILVMFSPLFFHFLIPAKTTKQSDVELDSLKQIYASKIDSIARASSYSFAEGKQTKTWSNNKNQHYSKWNLEKKEPYQSTNDTSPRYKKFAEYEPEEKKKFNLNSATIDDLKQVKGIGEVFATRIVKYRERLGGFNSKNQLYEVYQIDSLVVQNTFDYLSGDLLPTAKLKINTQEFKVVLKHPYLEYKEVQILFNNRPIASDEMLCRLLPDKCEKLSPYLDYSY